MLTLANAQSGRSAQVLFSIADLADPVNSRFHNSVTPIDPILITPSV